METPRQGVSAFKNIVGFRTRLAQFFHEVPQPNLLIEIIRRVTLLFDNIGNMPGDSAGTTLYHYFRIN